MPFSFVVNGLHDSLDDSAVGRSVDTSIGFVTSMEDEEEVFEENRNDENTNSDGSDQVVQKCHKIGMYYLSMKKEINLTSFFLSFLLFMLLLIPQFFYSSKRN